MTELQARPGADVIEAVVAQGDLSKLTPQQRVDYYLRVCQSLGLNPATRPFEYLTLKQDGEEKMILYARKDASDQLRQIHKVNIVIASREKMDDVYIVTAHATTPDGRTDESIGAVSLMKEDGTWETASSGKRYFKGNGNWLALRGDALANALMKAETKAKRRAALSICGLGFTDESELETIPNARTVTVDSTTGEIKPEPPQIEASKQEQSQQGIAQHNNWGADQTVLKAFWPWIKAQGLTNVECHKALGVEHLVEFNGTEADARKAITDYVARNSAA